MRRFVAIALLALAACAGKHSAPLHGTPLTPIKAAPSFTLTDQQDRPYTLASGRGQAALLYFGYTHCKDVCPQTLAMLGKAREDAHLAPAQLRIVMVTIDPKHDTPAALAAFFRKIGVKAIGLTGTQKQLAPVYKAYGVAIQPQKGDIGHTDMIYLIDAYGRMREVFGPDLGVHAVAADLRTVVD